VLNTGNSFLTGPGARNGDGVAHARVDYAEGTTSDFATLGFVPEPASLILVVVGMSGLGLVSRTLFAVRCRENDRGALR
jgi:hypothetical protein